MERHTVLKYVLIIKFSLSDVRNPRTTFPFVLVMFAAGGKVEVSLGVGSYFPAQTHTKNITLTR